MTRAELITAVKREGRILVGANLDTLVSNIIDEILVDYCNLARYYELLTEGEEITLVDGRQSFELPDDFGHLAAVRYGRGPATATIFRSVLPQPQSVNQTYSQGFPRFYRLVSGNKISFWPYGNIVATDQLFIDYYINPTSIFLSDDDAFPVPRLESSVKKDAIARVQRFHSANEEATITKTDSKFSFNASDAGA